MAAEPDRLIWPLHYFGQFLICTGVGGDLIADQIEFVIGQAIMVQRVLLAVLATALLTGCTTLVRSEDTPQVVVLGRLSNQSYEPVEIPDDILGYGWFTAVMRIDRVLEGRLSSRRISVRYFAHTYYRKDKSMRFRLKREENGGYVVCAPKGASGYKCHPEDRFEPDTFPT